MRTKPGHYCGEHAPECTLCNIGLRAKRRSYYADCPRCHGTGHYCPGGDVRSIGDGVITCIVCDQEVWRES